MKKCTICGIEKDQESFHNEFKNGKWKKKAKCKVCANKHTQAWKEKNRDRQRETNRKSYYKHREKESQRNKKYDQAGRVELSDRYIRTQIANQSGRKLKESDIPNELIELKRARVLIYRIKKQIRERHHKPKRTTV